MSSGIQDDNALHSEPPHPEASPSNSVHSGIGVFGGSFDPIHVGHLWMAEAALDQLPINHVRWIPAATSPLKPNGPLGDNSQRLQMLRLALAGQSGHEIDTWELDQNGVSYTVDTLEHLHAKHPDSPLFLIIGADSLDSFDRWKSPTKILDLCTLAVIARGGHAPPDYSILNDFASEVMIEQCRAAEIKMPQIEVSSSDLRKRIASKRSIRFQTPHPVEVFIRSESLYQQN
ncbi:nicotinate (nicotinamide) nucleotide adenylyltransferase [Neorhodopirellula lusitana]|uniref:nicotinate (nicotinamide) nucleotide adenylyltransferase n=1 Tax=Neorhodopirellula lusitana TaxID=445327 RepID=UPI00384C3B0C